MQQTALFIRHRAKPGQREAVHQLWAQHMQPAIAAHDGHEAYFYCFSDSDPDAICVFQQYASAEAAQAFLKTDAYRTYETAVADLLAPESSLTAATPIWSKP